MKKALALRLSLFKWFLGVACLSAVVWILTSLPWQHPDAIPQPSQVKLMDIVETHSKISFAAPSGELFSFLVAAPQMLQSSNALDGTIVLRLGGETIYQSSFNRAQLKECNWLSKTGLQAYIVGWNQPEKLDARLQPAKEYEISLVLGQKPESKMSLWLAFIQTNKAERVTATN